MFCLLAGSLAAMDVARDVKREADGAIRIEHPDFPVAARNVWPAAEETAFWKRVNHFLPTWRGGAARPHRTLESQGHDHAMLAWLAGDRE